MGTTTTENLMSDQKPLPTACVDPEVYDAGITFHNRDGQHRIMYSTQARLAHLLRLHGEPVTGQAVKLATGAWNYTWRDADGGTQARILLGEHELEQFVQLDPTREIPERSLATDDIHLLGRCRAADDRRGATTRQG